MARAAGAQCAGMALESHRFVELDVAAREKRGPEGSRSSLAAVCCD